MKRGLQIVIALLTILPFSFGLLGIFAGVSRFMPSGSTNANLDSQFRFLSAWYLGLALLAWWILPTIEKHTAIFRIICASVFIGGLARLMALKVSGLPDTRFLVVLVIELAFPLLILWHNKVQKDLRDPGKF